MDETQTSASSGEFAAAVHVPGSQITVEGVLFLPANVARARGVISIIDWSLAPALFTDTEWKALSEELQSCLLLVTIRTDDPEEWSRPTDEQPVRNAAVGGADGLLLLLEHLAEQSGHPELRSARLLLWGQSAAGGFAMTFATEHPSRTIGFVRYHSHLRELPVDIETAARIPALFLAGETDETAGVADSEALWRRGRALGAPWTFGIEPEAAHRSPEKLKDAYRVAIPWVAAVFRQRLGPDADLRPISDRSGWLADLHDGSVSSYASFHGNAREASWLPDEATAQGWRIVTGF